MTSYKVVLTRHAEADLESIYGYITEYDSPDKADYVLNQLIKATDNLTTFPEKGSIPRELQGLGIREFRQTLFKPYRIIYQIIAKQVVIYVISDGRRDMQTLLTNRLLGR